MFDINSNVPLPLAVAFVIGGLFLLSWSADRFVASAAKIARAFGVSQLIVGMVIIGFGTSAPELAVSVLSGLSGHSSLSLGNAYGSCIFNILIILGVAALIRPIEVKPSVNFVGVPLLLGVTLLSYGLVVNGTFSRTDGVILLVVFLLIMPAYCIWDQKRGAAAETERETVPDVAGADASTTKATAADFLLLGVGLALLVASSHVLVWGCVDLARDVFHVSDLLIGLTVVAAGTSLPELASAVASARRGEHDFVLGNIIGSNLFNTLAVVGIAGTIAPFSDFSPFIVTRDLPVMAVASLSVALFGIRYRHPARTGRINRLEGALWILAFVTYTAVMLLQESR